MLVSRNGAVALACMMHLGAPAPLLLAKGLDELSEQNPEDASAASPEAADPKEGQGDKAGDEDAKVPIEPSAISKALAGNFFLNTSFGWVRVSKSEGSWTSSGMSDVTFGHKLPVSLGSKTTLFGTYRYAPVAVSGHQEASSGGTHSYRGVWESHFFGSRLHYSITDQLRALASFELGYVAPYLDSTDGLAVEKSHEDNGAAVALGTGADWQLAENFAFAAGPRLYASFGTFRTVQFGCGLSLLF